MLDNQVNFSTLTWDSDAVAIDSAGLVWTTRNLDYSEGFILVTITATSDLMPVLTATATLLITINDVNNNPPVVNATIQLTATSDVGGESAHVFSWLKW